MARIPVLSRLNPLEYIGMILSISLVCLEGVIRFFTLMLPPSLVTILYRVSKRVFHWALTPARRRSLARSRKNDMSSKIQDAYDFVDLCALWGYAAEEHVVQTTDGYLLCLHRVAWKRGDEDIKVNSSKGGIKKPVVYLHHGLLMNSEIWVCLTDEQRNLPFLLVERGYDVWLGNNRGNKYSKKSIHHPPTSPQFWDFSMDEFAFHDIPDSINYILNTTGQASLSYIGFSQGTAQAFATLSIHPKLNDKVNVFVALAPAMAPAGLRNGVVDSLMKASPQLLFLLFGRKSILSSATMWQSILYPPIFVRAIDMSLSFLFGWQAQNISFAQKLAAYPHLYSFTSTKSVVHWFQIIRTKAFQMYDDDIQSLPILSGASLGSKYSRVARFPTRNIKTPCVLVYGGSDSLVDIDVMLRQLPQNTVATKIPHYEHLDFLWARDVDTLVFPHVLDALESFSEGHEKEHFDAFKAVRDVTLAPSMGSYADVAKEGAEMNRGTNSEVEQPQSMRKRSKAERRSDSFRTAGQAGLESEGSSSYEPNGHIQVVGETHDHKRPDTASTTVSIAASGADLSVASSVIDEPPDSVKLKTKVRRKGSNVSFDFTKGISPPVGKPVGGVSMGGFDGSDDGSIKTSGGRKKGRK